MTAKPRPAWQIEAIGVVRSPFADKASAPRQASLAKDVRGTIELFPGFEDALTDVAAWTHVWILFYFHLATGWRPKVQPPRSQEKKGVFSTRSPHRPNPIGMSAVALERVSGLVLHVRGLDLVDGTPVIDLKPYVAYADAIPDAGAGWLEEKDPGPRFSVAWSGRASEAAAWIGDGLRERVEVLLGTGPEPHAYRRIRRDGEGYKLAYQAWRIAFTVDRASSRIDVLRMESGYRPKELARAEGPDLDRHRAFVALFGGGLTSP